MGKISWKTYIDIPRWNLYNVEKYATDTYHHSKRIVGDATGFGRAFQIMPGGYGCMPFHI